jgi:hypothetical protein
MSADARAAGGDEPLAAALAYAARGWPVLPTREDKRPRTVHGLKDASRDEEQIRRWYPRTSPAAGVAIVTGRASGVIVLDVDGRAGAESLHELEREHGELPDTVRVVTGGGGAHYYFKDPGGVRNSAGKLGPGLDVRGDGGYVVCPPSPHPSGRRYEWDVPPDEAELAEPPAWLLEDAERRRNGRAPKVGPEIPEGQRDSTLASLAGTMRRRGMDESAIAAALKVENANRCRPPLAEAEVERIAASIARYEPAEGEPEPRREVEPVAITDAIGTFRRWLEMPDAGAVYAMLGTIAAQRLDRDPVWTLYVAPPGWGKTEALQAAAELPDVYPTATLTEPALLSGTAKRDRDKGATGGLLPTIGESGIILCKDFGSVLSMHRESRGQVLAALREVYDGSWTRHVGVDGGKTLSWSGKVGFLGGCTPTIDRAHAVMATMGERFLLYRLPEIEPGRQATLALAHTGREAEMRAELGHAVAGVFATELGEPRRLDDAERERLIALATFAVKARSPVERDGHTREIELVPESEAPARLAKVVEALLAGLDSLGVERWVAWRVAAKAALDCVPRLRRQAVEFLAVHGESGTKDVAVALDYPTGTVRRALEDLTAHRIVARSGGRNQDVWQLTEQAGAWYAHACVPDLSEEAVRA